MDGTSSGAVPQRQRTVASIGYGFHLRRQGGRGPSLRSLEKERLHDFRTSAIAPWAAELSSVRLSTDRQSPNPQEQDPCNPLRCLAGTEGSRYFGPAVGFAERRRSSSEQDLVAMSHICTGSSLLRNARKPDVGGRSGPLIWHTADTTFCEKACIFVAETMCLSNSWWFGLRC